MKSKQLADCMKALILQPGSILVVNRKQVDLKELARIPLEIDFTVPILAVDGPPDIHKFTRDQLNTALRLIDEAEAPRRRRKRAS